MKLTWDCLEPFSNVTKYLGCLVYKTLKMLGTETQLCINLKVLAR